MNEWARIFVSGDFGGTTYGPETALLVLVLAFCIGQVIGWVYMMTHVSLSYSRMYVTSIAVMPLIVALVMILMSGNVAIAFGLLAVFAVVRFRNVLKDTRDTVFILWSIVQGMAVGTMRFSTAIMGCVVVALVFAYLRFVSYGTRHRYDVVLSVHWKGQVASIGALKAILSRHSARVQLASQRDGPEEGLDLTYRLLLRDPDRSRELLGELNGAEAVAQASLYYRQDESEI
ncbi:MAG: DUF4956 domain-containing protein [Phycisphaerae bacterium]|jgi:hypothetical protein|nr:DUF4956 domain-containing protein [Phycisphaerae bacterium]